MRGARDRGRSGADGLLTRSAAVALVCGLMFRSPHVRLSSIHRLNLPGSVDGMRSFTTVIYAAEGIGTSVTGSGSQAHFEPVPASVIVVHVMPVFCSQGDMLELADSWFRVPAGMGSLS